MDSTSIAGACLASLIILAWLLDLRSRRAKFLPPGPKGLPLLGNALQMPKEQEWVAFRDLGYVHGDLVTLRIPGTTFVVLNSRQAMTELFEGRSGTYADRPDFNMCNLVGFEGAVVLSNNTPTFRTCRKLLRKGLGPSAVQSFIPFLNRQNAFFVEELLKTPDAFVTVSKRNAARISMKIAYGYDGITDDEHLFAVAVEVNERFSRTALLGVWLVDLIPILKYIPSWFPGAGFKRYAAETRVVVDECLNRPFDEVKKHMAQGTAGGSFCSMLLQSEKCDAELVECIKWSAIGLFEGQMDTTTAALSWFILAMAVYPEVQAKAKAEIDRVIGHDRLPQVSDKDSLPYVTAIMKEVFRWNPIVRLVPHAVSKDDEYRGYFIPAKSVMVANIWAVMHDEAVYHDADKFIPERFSEEGAPDSLGLAFGFGRRICPGMHIAQLHVFLTMATILATFDIRKAKDASGRVIEPEVVAMPGTITFPKPFKVSIQPRSPAAADLILRSAEHARTLPDRLEAFNVNA